MFDTVHDVVRRRAGGDGFMKASNEIAGYHRACVVEGHVGGLFSTARKHQLLAVA